MPRIKVISAGGFSRRPVSVLAEMHFGKVLVLTKFDVDLVMIYSGKKKRKHKRLSYYTTSIIYNFLDGPAGLKVSVCREVISDD